MTDKATDHQSLAERIADNLFSIGQDNEATRLVLARDTPAGPDGEKSYINLGGWCRQAVIDVINEVINGRK